MRWCGLLLLAAVPVACGRPASAVVVGSPAGCGADPVPQVAADVTRVAMALGPSRVLRNPDRRHLDRQVRQPVTSLVVFYSGHGTTGPEPGGASRSSRLCLADGPIRVRDLALAAGSTSSTVLILNSCQSSWVDLRGARVPTSVISASDVDTSPESWASDSGVPVPGAPSAFAELVAEALEGEADTNHADSNHDCLVTDRELIEALHAGIQRNGERAAWPPWAQPLPRLQHQSNGDVPVARLADQKGYCLKTWKEMTGLARALGPGEAADQLARQVDLASGKSSNVPEGLQDYYITTSPDPALAAAARERGFHPFPGDVAAASKFARLASFAEVYLLEVSPRWVRVVRLRDDHVMDSRPIEPSTPAAGVVGALPTRIRWIGAVAGRRLLLFSGRVPAGNVEVEGTVVEISRWVPYPCPIPTGQCFLEPDPGPVRKAEGR